MLEGGTDMVVAEVGLRYRRPAAFDDELDIAAEVIRLGTTSITTRFTVTRAGEEPVLAEGEVRHVFVDPSTKRKKEIPDDIRRRLAQYTSAL
jgi:acyl-CoA thioester hydrolase